MPRHTRRAPHCPNCGATVYRTHTCHAPARDAGRLVPPPADWRARVDAQLEGWQERLAAQGPAPEHAQLPLIGADLGRAWL